MKLNELIEDFTKWIETIKWDADAAPNLARQKTYFDYVRAIRILQMRAV